MSRKYKFHNKGGIYFVSFAVIEWIDVFVRPDYQEIIVDSLNYCIEHKEMILYCWCLMPSHIHLTFRAALKNPSDILRDFKRHTSKSIKECIQNNTIESRKNWILHIMRETGKSNSNVRNCQFWQQNNHPIELWSNKVIDQKLEYIHENPVTAGFVEKPEDWRLSSAMDYSGRQGMVQIEKL